MDIERVRQLGKDETTSPDILAQLAKSKDNRTRQSVVANPNTPTKILLNLSAEFPEELLNNPIFDLLFLENPSLIKDIPIQTLRNLIKQDNVPESFIIECAERESDEDLLLAMTMNSKLSRSILEKLYQSRFSEVSEAAILHVNWSGEIKQGWKEFAKNKIINLSSNYGGTECHYDLTVMVCAKLLPQEFLNYFGETKEGKHVLKSLQKREKSKNYIKTINKNSYEKNLTAIEKRNLYLKKLGVEPIISLQNYDRETIQELIFNCNTSVDMLERIVDDYGIKFFIKPFSVKPFEALVNHPNVNGKLLNKIWKKILAKTEGNLREFNYLGEELLSLVTNPKIPDYVLEDIFKYRKHYQIHSIIVREIAAHPNTPLYILEGMVDEKYGFYQVLYLDGLLQNSNLPIHSWQKLIENKKNRSLHYPQIIPCFCEQHPDKLSLILKDYSEASSDLVRLIALLYLPFEQNKLDKLINSIHWIFRYGVTQNINATSQQLTKLTKDSNKVVRAAAKAQLETKQ